MKAFANPEALRHGDRKSEPNRAKLWREFRSPIVLPVSGVDRKARDLATAEHPQSGFDVMATEAGLRHGAGKYTVHACLNATKGAERCKTEKTQVTESTSPHEPG